MADQRNPPASQGTSPTQWFGLLLPVLLTAAGFIMVATGFLPWHDFLALAERTVPILLFVIAMTVVTELADAAGLFAWLTRLLAAKTSRVMALWLIVVLLSVLSTIFLSLDTTAVLVTPVVVTLALHAKISPLPFALTTIWLANTASLLLPVSNLTNLLAQHGMQTSPQAFAQLLWAPAIVGIAVPVAILAMLFRKDLRARFVPPSAFKSEDKALLRISAVTVVLLLPLLVSGIPVYIPASLAALFLVLVFLVRRRHSLSLSMIPSQPILLTAGLFMVVQTLTSRGLSTLLGEVAGSGEGFLALLQLAGAGALAANGINNLPAYLALEPLAGSPVRYAALLIGVNLGPLISPWASLATLLWHGRLTTMGVRISWWGYALAGLGLVVVLLPAAVLALWFTAG